jgi:FkbM family methyltransferase
MGTSGDRCRQSLAWLQAESRGQIPWRSGRGDNVLERAVGLLGSRRRPWSNADVVSRLLTATSSARDRFWISRYFLSRRTRGRVRAAVLPSAHEQGLSLRGLAGPLRLSTDSGGLATYYEIVEQRIYAPIDDFAPRSGDVVVDVGANIGVFSLWAADLVGPKGRVVAIEPTPIAFDVLYRNTSGIATPTTALAIACSDEDGTLTLHFPPGRLSVASAEPRKDRTEHVDVPVRRLQPALAEVGVTAIDFLKIDVEGLEIEVLRGAGDLLHHVDRLAMEVDLDGAEAVEELLARHGLHKVHGQSGMWGLSGASMACFRREKSEELG